MCPSRSQRSRCVSGFANGLPESGGALQDERGHLAHKRSGRFYCGGRSHTVQRKSYLYQWRNRGAKWTSPTAQNFV